MHIDVFTKQGCPPCKLLKMWLRKNGVVFNEKPIELERNLNEFTQLQGKGFPFVIIKSVEGEEIFLGNSPKLKKYLKEKYT